MTTNVTPFNEATSSGVRFIKPQYGTQRPNSGGIIDWSGIEANYLFNNLPKQLKSVSQFGHPDRPIPTVDEAPMPIDGYRRHVPSDVSFESRRVKKIPQAYRLPTNTELLMDMNTYPDGLKKHQPVENDFSRRGMVMTEFDTMMHQANNSANPEAVRHAAHRFLLLSDPALYQAVVSGERQAVHQRQMGAHRAALSMPGGAPDFDAQPMAPPMAPEPEPMPEPEPEPEPEVKEVAPEALAANPQDSGLAVIIRLAQEGGPALAEALTLLIQSTESEGERRQLAGEFAHLYGVFYENPDARFAFANALSALEEPLPTISVAEPQFNITSTGELQEDTNTTQPGSRAPTPLPSGPPSTPGAPAPERTQARTGLETKTETLFATPDYELAELRGVDVTDEKTGADRVAQIARSYSSGPPPTVGELLLLEDVLSSIPDLDKSSLVRIYNAVDLAVDEQLARAVRGQALLLAAYSGPSQERDAAEEFLLLQQIELPESIGIRFLKSFRQQVKKNLKQ